MAKSIRLIGDIHQDFNAYRKIIKDCEYSVQLGDFGFNYTSVSNINPDRHKVVVGNHDNHENYSPHFLDRWGYTSLNGIQFFYIGGSFSIDRAWRTAYIDWWPTEELSAGEMSQCFKVYSALKPKLVLSHDCPAGIVDDLLNGRPRFATSSTSRFLQHIWDEHKPQLWIFGHWHISFAKQINGTMFRCLNVNEYYDLTIEE